MDLNPNNRLIVSLDFAKIEDALNIVDVIKDDVVLYKVGLQMFIKYGFTIINELKKRKLKIFLDLKLNDIPNTVVSAVEAIADYSIDIINMHTLSGFRAMKETKESILKNSPETKLVGVTVLTSLNNDDLRRLGFSLNTSFEAEKLSLLAKEAGLDGVVSSAKEALRVKELCGSNFLTICPGIRRAEDSSDDQQRVSTPLSAIKNGADYIVVGRPIIKAVSPKVEALKIIKEIEKGLLSL